MTVRTVQTRTTQIGLSRHAAQAVGAVSAAALILAYPLIAAAQSDENGGVTASFDVSQGIRIDDNPSLATSGAETLTSAVTRLDFGLQSQTRTQLLAFSMGTGLRFDNSTDTDESNGLIDPTFGLTYSREAAAASFEISASYIRRDFGYSSTLSDILVAGQALPGDLTDLTGTGTRTAIGLDATLELRSDRPFGITLHAGVDDLSYEDATDSDLVDSTRATLGATARFTISPVLDATLGVTGIRYEEVGTAASDMLSVQTGVALARPDGSYGAELSFTDSDEGRQYALSLSRDIVFRNATLAAALGVSRATTGNVYTTGSLDYTFDNAAGTFVLGIDRSLSADSSDSEEVLTSLTLGATYALTPAGTLGADLTVARSEETLTGLGTDVASLGLTYDHALSRDWSVQASYGHEWRAPDDSAEATANSFGLTLSRSFDFRF